MASKIEIGYSLGEGWFYRIRTSLSECSGCSGKVRRIFTCLWDGWGEMPVWYRQDPYPGLGTSKVEGVIIRVERGAWRQYLWISKFSRYSFARHFKVSSHLLYSIMSRARMNLRVRLPTWAGECRSMGKKEIRLNLGNFSLYRRSVASATDNKYLHHLKCVKVSGSTSDSISLSIAVSRPSGYRILSSTSGLYMCGASVDLYIVNQVVTTGYPRNKSPESEGFDSRGGGEQEAGIKNKDFCFLCISPTNE